MIKLRAYDWFLSTTTASKMANDGVSLIKSARMKQEFGFGRKILVKSLLDLLVLKIPIGFCGFVFCHMDSIISFLMTSTQELWTAWCTSGLSCWQWTSFWPVRLLFVICRHNFLLLLVLLLFYFHTEYVTSYKYGITIICYFPNHLPTPITFSLLTWFQSQW